MALTPNERAYLDSLSERLDRLRALLGAGPSLNSASDTTDRFAFLAAMKVIQGNTSNDLSFVATLMARDYLAQTVSLRPFDAAAKAQGAPGLDIDQCTLDGERVVAEIKTTTPYKADDLGAQQKATFAKDFAKLAAADAAHKFLFVTDGRTFAVLRRKYRPLLTGVTVVLLPAGESFTG